MIIHSQELFTRAKPAGAWGRAAQFPLTRIPIAVLFIAPAILLHNLVTIYFIERFENPLYSVLLDSMSIIDVLLILYLYRLFVRKVERREPVEVSLPGSPGEFGAGLLLALGLVGVTVMILAVTGSYGVEGTGSPWILLHALFRFGVGAFLQVMIFRILLFRLSEELLGTWIAFALIAGAFGAAHLVNENLTPFTFAALALGDFLMMAAFVLTRRLWLVWGIHAGWNFFQDGLFGMPNSGVTSLPSWITPRIEGPDWLTGGYFGIEASLPALLITVVVGAWIMSMAIRRGQIVLPAWARRRA